MRPAHAFPPPQFHTLSSQMNTLATLLLAGYSGLAMAAATTSSFPQATYSYSTAVTVPTDTVFDYSNLKQFDVLGNVEVAGELIVDAQAGANLNANSFRFTGGTGTFAGSGDLTIKNSDAYSLAAGSTWDIDAQGKLTFESKGQTSNQGKLYINNVGTGSYDVGYILNSDLLFVSSFGTDSILTSGSITNTGSIVFNYTSGAQFTPQGDITNTGNIILYGAQDHSDFKPKDNIVFNQNGLVCLTHTFYPQS